MNHGILEGEASGGEPLKNCRMEWTVKFDAADVSGNPTHRRLHGFKSIELDPNALADGWTLHELDLAAACGRIEHAHSKRLQSRAPDSHFGSKYNPISDAGFKMFIRAHPAKKALTSMIALVKAAAAARRLARETESK